MTLSTYYNYYPFQTSNNSQFITFHEQPLLPEQLPPQNYHHFSSSYLDETESFFIPTSTYFDPTSTLTYPDNEINPYPSQLFHSSFNEIFPTEENYNYLPCPKRQKYCVEEEQLLHSSLPQEVMSNNYLLDEFLLNPNPNTNAFSMQVEEPICAVEEFNKVSNEGIVDVDEYCDKKGNNERTISAQSLAARERRRKITEKTQELGKLVPGGPKMNTAEMLHAAGKYVKYLQAQVGMLQLMEETITKEDKAAARTEDLHKLVVSPFVQEKLYSEERCFVPKEFVTTLTNYENVRSKPIILKDLKQLIELTNTKRKPKQEQISL